MSSNPNPEQEPQEPQEIQASNTPAETAARELSAAEEDEVKHYLAQAEVAAKAENWDETIALYRKALAIDRIREGVEAKLQWALRMRDIDKLYRDGKAKFDAGDYEGALPPLRKARVMYASHYKDTDDLILQAQSHVQQDKWDARPEDAKGGGETQSHLFHWHSRSHPRRYFDDCVTLLPRKQNRHATTQRQNSRRQRQCHQIRIGLDYCARAARYR